MFKKFIINILLKIAKKEVESYIDQISKGNQKQHGVILAHACLTIAQIVKKKPFIENIFESQVVDSLKELSIIVSETDSLIKEYHDDGDFLNAAGIKLWNETFRCLSYEELEDYGKSIWLYFSRAQNDATKYLDDLEEKFNIENNQKMIDKIQESRKYINLVPKKYKK